MLSRPPGPKGHWLAGSLPDVRRDMLGFWTRCAREYGDIVHLRYVHQHHYMLSHPDFIEQMLIHLQPVAIKWWPLRVLSSYIGHGLGFNEGDVWKRQRRLVQPAFHGERLQQYGAIMVEHAEQLVARWTSGQEINTHHDLKMLALGIVYSTLFGTDITKDAEKVSASVLYMQKHFQHTVMAPVPLPLQVPTLRNVRMWLRIRKLDRILYRMIADRRGAAEKGHDVLSTLIETRDEDNSQMTDRQIRDELNALFIAGFDSSALTMTWTLYLLATHPDIEARVVSEIAEVCGDRPPRVEDLRRLQYTESVIKESLRLYPPAYVMGRELTRDCEIGGYTIPKGSQVFASQWVVHRDPRFYDEPDACRPERWMQPPAARLPHMAFFPFGGGPHKCIGSQFALMEILLVLSTILRRVKLRVAPAQRITLQPAIFLQPLGGIPARVLAREAVAVSS